MTTTLPSMTAPRRRTLKRSVFFVALLVLLVSVFTILGVSQLMELGSAAFFFVVVAGVLVLLLFFCGLIAYARSKLISVHSLPGDDDGGRMQSVPVFYFLQTIHRPQAVDPVKDDEYWLSKDGEKIYLDSKQEAKDQCPICLCDIDPMEATIGVSACCKRELHVKCAQEYFNTIRQVKCVYCRKNVEEFNSNLDGMTTAAPTPEPTLNSGASPRASQV